jgi:hypothetical protein
MKRGDLRDPDLLDEPPLDPQAPRYMTRLQRALYAPAKSPPQRNLSGL